MRHFFSNFLAFFSLHFYYFWYGFGENEEKQTISKKRSNSFDDISGRKSISETFDLETSHVDKDQSTFENNDPLVTNSFKRCKIMQQPPEEKVFFKSLNQQKLQEMLTQNCACFWKLET